METNIVARSRNGDCNWAWERDSLERRSNREPESGTGMDIGEDKGERMTVGEPSK